MNVGRQSVPIELVGSFELAEFAGFESRGVMPAKSSKVFPQISLTPVIFFLHKIIVLFRMLEVRWIRIVFVYTGFMNFIENYV